MPIIECTIERDGPTTINDGGFTFVFKENEAGHRVCNVLSDGTAQRLLSFAWFRKYNPEEDYKKETPEKLKDEDYEEENVSATIRQLRADGMSYRAIADAVGKNKDYVARAIKDQKQEA